jgi:hypothetical protein
MTHIKVPVVGGPLMPAADQDVLSRLLEIHVHRRRLTFLMEELRDLDLPTDGLERLIDGLRREATELLARLEVERHKKAA